jgi:hypothetical protein
MEPARRSPSARIPKTNAYQETVTATVAARSTWVSLAASRWIAPVDSARTATAARRPALASVTAAVCRGCRGLARCWAHSPNVALQRVNVMRPSSVAELPIARPMRASRMARRAMVATAHAKPVRAFPAARVAGPWAARAALVAQAEREQAVQQREAKHLLAVALVAIPTPEVPTSAAARARDSSTSKTPVVAAPPPAALHPAAACGGCWRHWALVFGESAANPAHGAGARRIRRADRRQERIDRGPPVGSRSSGAPQILLANRTDPHTLGPKSS